MSCLWNVLSLKCPVFEMSYLLNVLSLKCLIYEISCHGMSCHGMSCHEMSCYGMSCHEMSCHGMSCHEMSSHEMSCHSRKWSIYEMSCLENVLSMKCPILLSIKLPIQNLSPTRANSASHNEVENISSILINKSSKNK